LGRSKWGSHTAGQELSVESRNTTSAQQSKKILNSNPNITIGTMRLSQTPPSLLSLLLVVLSQTDIVRAGPYPKDDLHDFGFSYLMDRDCAFYCGVDNQYCCTAGQACYTNAQNIAACTNAGGGGGGYVVYTTTYTETDLILRTSTYSSWYTSGATTTQVYVQPAPTVVAPAICTPSLGESSCGIICCASDQRCAEANTCTPYSSSYYVATSVATSAASTFSAPLRPTSGGISTTTAVVSATTTQGFIPPATASGSTIPIASANTNNGLSAGAIAGIVIGVIAGVILLLLFCFCCIIKAGFDGLLALFGLGKRRRGSRERVEVVEERYSRHGSERRNNNNTWFGSSRPTRVTETRKKRSSGFGGFGMVGAGLLGLAAVLGLKRSHDRRNEKPARSDISSSYYSYTDTSASSASSDRRTRDTRGTRHTRR